MTQGPLEPRPYDPPMAQPLEYAMPAARRPGLVTAMGVISIVLGSSSILASMISGLYAVFVFVFVGMSSTMPWGIPGSASLLPQEQQAVVSVLTQKAALSAAEQANLNSLLGEHGSTIFDRTRGTISSQRVSQDLQGSGAVAAAGPSAAPSHWFMLSSGRIEIGDDFAAFYPAKTSAASAPSTLEPETPGKPTGAQIDLAADEITKMAAATPDARQTQALKEVLGQGAKLLAPSNDRRNIRMQVAGMTPTSDGGMNLFMTSGSTVYLPPSGGQRPVAGLATPGNSSSTVTVVGPNGTVTTTTTASSGTGGGSGPKFGPKLKAGATLALIEAVLSFGLAIYLLVIGILVFRWSRRGTVHHLIFAWTKMLLAVLFVGGWWLVIRAFINSFSAMPGGAGMAGMEIIALIWVAIPAALSLIYPIALLFVLRSRTVRTYYQTIGT